METDFAPCRKIATEVVDPVPDLDAPRAEALRRGIGDRQGDGVERAGALGVERAGALGQDLDRLGTAVSPDTAMALKAGAAVCGAAWTRAHFVFIGPSEASLIGLADHHPVSHREFGGCATEAPHASCTCRS